MKKRIISLLLAAVLLCSVFSDAWAAEQDKYQVFVNKYGPEYEELDWEQAIDELGGLDAIDWKTLALSAGYEGEKKIDWDPLMSIAGFSGYFSEIWPQVSEAKTELTNEHFADAPELVQKYCNRRIMEKYPLDALDGFLD